MTLPPPWVEQRPTGREAARWLLRFPDGADLTFAVVPAGIEIRTGPGTIHPVTDRTADLWAVAHGAAALAQALEVPEPAPAEQPSLFDPQAEEATRG